jgi:hypothetical protein
MKENYWKGRNVVMGFKEAKTKNPFVIFLVSLDIRLFCN